ncbi:MAG: hypothetical protein ER33_02550 [Cyanobium sp. CACIAM 14]|nr:MAG: hypothetical protein ER33_02550 [Cyanobium sp. CACIAM 14]
MEILEGEGWRLQVDPARAPYPALIGGHGWASELTGAELRALRLGLQRLLEQHRALAGGLMAEEALDLELELRIGPERGDAPGVEHAKRHGGDGGSLWLGLSGDRHRWSLRLVLTPAPGCRAIEGSWGIAASGAFAAALERLRPADLDGRNQDC